MDRINKIIKTPRKSTSSQIPGVKLKTACDNVMVENERTNLSVSKEPTNIPVNVNSAAMIPMIINLWMLAGLYNPTFRMKSPMLTFPNGILKMFGKRYKTDALVTIKAIADISSLLRSILKRNSNKNTNRKPIAEKAIVNK